MKGIWEIKLVVDDASRKVLGASIKLDDEPKPVILLNIVEALHDREAGTLADLMDFLITAHRQCKGALSIPPDEPMLF